MYSSTCTWPDVGGGCVVSVTIRPLYPRKGHPIPLYRKHIWAAGCSGRVQETSPARGLEPRSFQPVALRNNGYVTPTSTNYEALQHVIFPTALLYQTQNQIFSSVFRSEIYLLWILSTEWHAYRPRNWTACFKIWVFKKIFENTRIRTEHLSNLFPSF